ncbi:MAG TPA: GPP34 family phosphoprotein [Jatrophihabitans sp.]|nr:GPP34 family phosphoprotein [Jatrophihabitans sp.]
MPASNRAEPIGVTVCRLSLDPVRGRLRHPMQVGIAIRAGMFAELTLAGRIIGRNWPQAVGESRTGNPLPDAVHRAVANRHPTNWRRWYGHVHADRNAAVDYLVASGRWQRNGKRIVDPQAAETVLEQQEILRSVNAGEPPDDLREMMVRLLVTAAGGAGRPAPVRTWKVAKVWLTQRLPEGPNHAAYHGMRAGFRAIRRAATFRLFSR